MKFDAEKTPLTKSTAGVKCLGFLVKRLSFSELFDDISRMFKVRRLCVVVDNLISAAKGVCLLDREKVVFCGLFKLLCKP